MKKYSVLWLCLLILSSCQLNDETTALVEHVKQEKVWVFAQFNVPEEGDVIDSLYYYGTIPKSLYTLIQDNRIQQGFIVLSEVKYWGQDDLIHAYAGIEHTGELVFRIEDIRRLKLLNAVPKAGLGSEQFDEPAVVEAATQE
ncbi:MAG: hypothetical protein Q9M19_05025 [Mariprofundaceae bacterium]|nr:hypothetical protein [Mariprofundaceae bacterium]